jgi:hypothetical protein
LDIIGRGEAYKKMIDGTAYYEPIEIVYRLASPQTTPKEKAPFQMLFVFEDIKDKFETFLRNWFAKAESLNPFLIFTLARCIILACTCNIVF